MSVRNKEEEEILCILITGGREHNSQFHSYYLLYNNLIRRHNVCKTSNIRGNKLLFSSLLRIIVVFLTITKEGEVSYTEVWLNNRQLSTPLPHHQLLSLS